MGIAIMQNYDSLQTYETSDKLRTDFRRQTPTSDFGFWTSNFEFHTSDLRLQTDFRLQTSDIRSGTSNCELKT